MKIQKITFKICPETIRDYYPKYALTIYEGDLVKVYTGHLWQFEFTTEKIAVYDDLPTGQDMERKKGAMIFLIDTAIVEQFEQVGMTPRELEFCEKMLSLNSAFLNKEITKELHQEHKDNLMEKYAAYITNINLKPFQMPYEWL
jgi:hypothetical protein